MFTFNAPTLQELCLNTVIAHFDVTQDKLTDQPPLFINNIYEKLFQVFNSAMDPQLRQIPPQSIIQLRHLNLQNKPQCTNGIIVAIGHCCPLLQHLDISNCTNVNDVSILTLGSCLELQYLDIRDTGITADGCLYILNELPALTTFKIDFWQELFPVMKWEFGHTLRSYGVEATSVVLEEYEDVLVMIGIFPNLRSLNVSGRLDVDVVRSLWDREMELSGLDGLLDLDCHSVQGSDDLLGLEFHSVQGSDDLLGLDFHSVGNSHSD